MHFSFSTPIKQEFNTLKNLLAGFALFNAMIAGAYEGALNQDRSTKLNGAQAEIGTET